MPYKTTINVGFITNSSSVVHGFPRRILEHPDVQAVLNAYEVADGFVSNNLSYRSKCDSLLITKEQKRAVQSHFNNLDDDLYGPEVQIPCYDDTVMVIYGDEYSGLASIICEVMSRAAVEMNESETFSQEFH